MYVYSPHGGVVLHTGKQLKFKSHVCVCGQLPKEECDLVQL